MAGRQRMLAVMGMITVLLIGAGATGGPSEAATPICGQVPAESADGKPVRADLTPGTAAHVITLGTSVKGSRSWQVEFTWTADCTLVPPLVKPRMTHLQGSDASVSGSGIRAVAEVDNDARRVVVDIDVPRQHSVVPPGKFDGTLEVGDGTVGLGKAAITIRHQEPLVLHNLSAIEQFVWIVVLCLIAAVLFAYRKLPFIPGVDNGNFQDYTTPLAVIVGGTALYPIFASLGQSKGVPAPWWPLWLGAAGLAGGFILGVLKHRSTSNGPLVRGHRFAAAMFISFGTGITVWRAQYLNTPDWALTVESALGLMGIVGGATATTALLLLTPDTTPPPPPPPAGSAGAAP